MLFSIFPIVFYQKRGWMPASASCSLPLIGTVIDACLSGLALFTNSQVDQKNSTRNRKQSQKIAFPAPWPAGSSILVVFINYIPESYLMYAASAVAANTVLRFAFAAASQLFTQYMFDAPGRGGAGSLIGGVGVLLMPTPFVFHKYGTAIRARSRFAPTEETPPHPMADEENVLNAASRRQASERKEKPIDESTRGLRN
ncbi:hypothetical protein VTI74DRAFT_594 [Chaetomium olivicolor]